MAAGAQTVTNFNSGAGVAQLVERVLAKHKVVGSKPITRSTETPGNCEDFSRDGGAPGARLTEIVLEAVFVQGVPFAGLGWLRRTVNTAWSRCYCFES